MRVPEVVVVSGVVVVTASGVIVDEDGVAVAVVGGVVVVSGIAVVDEAGVMIGGVVVSFVVLSVFIRKHELILVNIYTFLRKRRRMSRFIFHVFYN